MMYLMSKQGPMRSPLRQIIPSKFTVSESQDEVTNFRMGRVWKNGTNGKSVEKWNENTGNWIDLKRTDGSSRLPNLLTW